MLTQKQKKHLNSSFCFKIYILNMSKYLVNYYKLHLSDIFYISLLLNVV